MAELTAETAFDTRIRRAGAQLDAFDLDSLLHRHEDALERFLEARRQHAEAKRLLQDAGAHVDDVELEALLEMEQRPGYVPGKNAEARKQQAELWLAKHAGFQAARGRQRGMQQAVTAAELDVDRARAQVDHLELMIGARRSELDLLASFARGTV